MTDEYLQVITTTATEEEAGRLARSVVEARLAACAQVLGPITSTFWWRGGIDTTPEWICLMKTTGTRFDALVAHLKAHHSYEVPEITATPISRGSDDYLAWISDETGDLRS
ncbi:MAG TPA: divalent-cation tolerance protein CutA [Candidatus Dormibacteraeota bacterium]|nr:divalent-cation tolerance protein CutA [Candidatus Dormibacteraeota bacterium]